jgi:hypothetical protein
LCRNDWITKESPVPNQVIDDDDEIIIPKIVQGSSVNSSDQDGKKQVDAKVYQQMKQLDSSFNPEASKIVEEFQQGRKTLLGYANMLCSQER